MLQVGEGFVTRRPRRGRMPTYGTCRRAEGGEKLRPVSIVIGLRYVISNKATYSEFSRSPRFSQLKNSTAAAPKAQHTCNLIMAVSSSPRWKSYLYVAHWCKPTVTADMTHWGSSTSPTQMSAIKRTQKTGEVRIRNSHSSFGIG